MYDLIVVIVPKHRDEEVLEAAKMQVLVEEQFFMDEVFDHLNVKRC